ncbi:MAG: outer membrane protein assembly factor [Bacteroidota bacterium]|nr:outer membrane protein assembly factor [Bacteroidota bacterium]
MKNIYNCCIALLLVLNLQNVAFAQNSDSLGYKKIAAGPEYKRSSFYQWLWGKNYRKEWTTPVVFPVVMLDTLQGGITAFKKGGGHQSKSLHVKTADGKDYALRSVDKTLDILVPKIFHGTFIQHIANDEISMSHPYGALGVPLMAQAAGIPHASPKFIYVPQQPKLDSLNKVYGNRLYLFEQRPSGDWSDADNFLNFKKFNGSDEMMDKIFEDNDKQVDQLAFVKARLFDMVIGDWDRHLDQWKWGTVDSGNQKIYVPIPTDRDQAFFSFDGVLLKLVIAAAGMKYVQPFDYKIHDIGIVERRFLDRLLTNKVRQDQWESIAKNLQESLTDNAIESSIKQMPPEIFAIRGNEIIAKLKSRRNNLVEYATEYYKYLAKEVEIVGSKGNEYFDINRLNENETAINVYKINKEGKKHDTPFYSRTFKSDETKEVRMYGLSGEDVYQINGNISPEIKIRIIGGDGKDSIINNLKEGKKIQVYDDRNNVFIGNKNRLHLSSDSAIHSYYYDTYNADKKGISPILGYTNEDPFFVGLGYNLTHYKWRKIPFAYKQSIGVKYSISQKAFSYFYQGLFPRFIGNWDLLLNADYDAIRWINFYGLGNESLYTTKDVKFNRTRSKEISGSIGLQQNFGKNTINISGFYQSVKIINDTARFIAKRIAPFQPNIYNQNNYAGASFSYKLTLLNDSIVPTAGLSFVANASHFQNITQSQSFQRYTGIVNFYIPLFSKFSLAIRGSGGTVSGNPLFYQLPHIGGADDLRGYRRERFFGKTAFANSNELRFITNMRSYLMNGKIGFTVFYDEGRVWQPGETSDTWHTDYGAGLLLAPFNKLLANLAYGISKEKKMIQLRLIKSF